MDEINKQSIPEQVQDPKEQVNQAQKPDLSSKSLEDALFTKFPAEDKKVCTDIAEVFSRIEQKFSQSEYQGKIDKSLIQQYITDARGRGQMTMAKAALATNNPTLEQNIYKQIVAYYDKKNPTTVVKVDEQINNQIQAQSKEPPVEKEETATVKEEVKSEEVKIEGDTSVVKEEKTKQEEEKTKVDEETATAKIELSQIEKDLAKAKESYDALADTVKPTADQLQVRKTTEAGQSFLKQLDANKIAPQDQANLINFEYVYKNHKNKNDLGANTFIQDYEKVRQNYAIIDSMSDVEKGAANTSTVDALYVNNDKLESYVNPPKDQLTGAPSRDNFKNISTPNYITSLKDETVGPEEVMKQIKFLDKNDPLLEQLTKQKQLLLYTNLFAEQEDGTVSLIPPAKISNLSKDIQDGYRTYFDILASIKEKTGTILGEKTNTILKQRVLGSMITGIAKYLDTSTAQGESLAADFALDPSSGFDIVKEGNNDVLHITGTIKGKKIGLYYNLTDPNAKLMVDDSLYFDKAKNTFYVGESSKGRRELPIVLPTIDALSLRAQDYAEKNGADILANADSLDEYTTSLKQDLSRHLGKSFGYEDLVKIRLEKGIEKDLAGQETIDLVNTIMGVPHLVRPRNDEISQAQNKEAHGMLKLIDGSLEGMVGLDEIALWRKNIAELSRLVADKQSKGGFKQDGLLRLFNQENTSLSRKNRSSGTHNTLFSFFDTISQNGKVDQNLLQSLLYNERLAPGQKPLPTPVWYNAKFEDLKKNNPDLGYENGLKDIEQDLDKAYETN